MELSDNRMEKRETQDRLKVERDLFLDLLELCGTFLANTIVCARRIQLVPTDIFTVR